MNELELVKLEKPELPVYWEYETSVKFVSETIFKWKNLTEDIAKELWIARKMLSKEGRNWDKSPNNKTWADYCENIGSQKRVVNRWLKQWFEEEKNKSLCPNVTGTMPSNVLLLEGDVFDKLKEIPDNSIDLLNTDPPYMILKNNWDTFSDKEDFLNFTEKWLITVMPKVKKSGRIYISFSQWYQYDLYNILAKHNFFNFIYKQNIIWYYKNNNQPSNRREYRYMYEPIFYLYGEDAKPLNFTEDTYGETQQNVWEIAMPQSNFNEGKFHSAQKPLELYERIVSTGSFEGDTVLDCFAGSGTTGIVCKDKNRNCILIENDPDNITIIKSRL